MSFQAVSVSKTVVFTSLLSLCFPLYTVASPIKISQSVNVDGPSVDCPSSNLKVAAPSTSVSAPNPSRLVPNVGKILRKGLGVPAPDSEAPNVSARADISSPTQTCASSDTGTSTSGSSSSTSVETSPDSSYSNGSSSSGVSGLW
ncbi:MAG TPA: hypothetical protein V6D19_23965 [Stenomitos sp.]